MNRYLYSFRAYFCIILIFLLYLPHVLNEYHYEKDYLVFCAFDDVGGKLSFALAMLDGNNTGFVLNAIHSKDNCFLYIKEVVAGESYIMLSNEEMKALQAASRFGEE